MRAVNPSARITCRDVPLMDGRTLRVAVDPSGGVVHIAPGTGVGASWRETPAVGGLTLPAYDVKALQEALAASQRPEEP